MVRRPIAAISGLSAEWVVPPVRAGGGRSVGARGEDGTMPLQNRVTPAGEIVADPGRGLMMGNRGCLHGPGRQLGASRWRSQAWICCVLEWRGGGRGPPPPGPGGGAVVPLPGPPRAPPRPPRPRPPPPPCPPPPPPP